MAAKKKTTRLPTRRRPTGGEATSAEAWRSRVGDALHAVQVLVEARGPTPEVLEAMTVARDAIAVLAGLDRESDAPFVRDVNTSLPAVNVRVTAMFAARRKLMSGEGEAANVREAAARFDLMMRLTRQPMEVRAGFLLAGLAGDSRGAWKKVDRAWLASRMAAWNGERVSGSTATPSTAIILAEAAWRADAFGASKAARMRLHHDDEKAAYRAFLPSIRKALKLPA